MDLAQMKAGLALFRTQQKEAAAKADAAGNSAAAQRHRERARMAKKGFMLEGEEELRDPNYCMDHQDLRGAAMRHGLIQTEPLPAKE